VSLKRKPAICFGSLLSASVLLRLVYVYVFVCFALQHPPWSPKALSPPACTFVCVIVCGVLCVSISFISYYVNAWDLRYFLGLVNFQLVLLALLFVFLSCGIFRVWFSVSAVRDFFCPLLCFVWEALTRRQWSSKSQVSSCWHISLLCPFLGFLRCPFRFFHAEASGRREETAGGYNSGVSFPFMEQVCSGNVSFLSSGGSCCTVSDIHPHVSCMGHPECFRIFSSFGLAVWILRLVFFLQVYLKTNIFAK